MTSISSEKPRPPIRQITLADIDPEIYPPLRIADEYEEYERPLFVIDKLKEGGKEKESDWISKEISTRSEEVIEDVNGRDLRVDRGIDDHSPYSDPDSKGRDISQIRRSSLPLGFRGEQRRFEELLKTLGWAQQYATGGRVVLPDFRGPVVGGGFDLGLGQAPSSPSSSSEEEGRRGYGEALNPNPNTVGSRTRLYADLEARDGYSSKSVSIEGSFSDFTSRSAPNKQVVDKPLSLSASLSGSHHVDIDMPPDSNPPSKLSERRSKPRPFSSFNEDRATSLQQQTNSTDPSSSTSTSTLSPQDPIPTPTSTNHHPHSFTSIGNGSGGSSSGNSSTSSSAATTQNLAFRHSISIPPRGRLPSSGSSMTSYSPSSIDGTTTTNRINSGENSPTAMNPVTTTTTTGGPSSSSLPQGMYAQQQQQQLSNPPTAAAAGLPSRPSMSRMHSRSYSRPSSPSRSPIIESFGTTPFNNNNPFGSPISRTGSFAGLPPIMAAAGDGDGDGDGEGSVSGFGAGGTGIGTGIGFGIGGEVGEQAGMSSGQVSPNAARRRSLQSRPYQISESSSPRMGPTSPTLTSTRLGGRSIFTGLPLTLTEDVESMSLPSNIRSQSPSTTTTTTAYHDGSNSNSNPGSTSTQLPLALAAPSPQRPGLRNVPNILSNLTSSPTSTSDPSDTKLQSSSFSSTSPSNSYPYNTSNIVSRQQSTSQPSNSSSLRIHHSVTSPPSPSPSQNQDARRLTSSRSRPDLGKVAMGPPGGGGGGDRGIPYRSHGGLGIKELVQQKRRQASAPFFSSASSSSLFGGNVRHFPPLAALTVDKSGNNGVGVGVGVGVGGSSSAGVGGGRESPSLRMNGRKSSRVGTFTSGGDGVGEKEAESSKGPLKVSLAGLNEWSNYVGVGGGAGAGLGVSASGNEGLLGELVMTPTTEEWRSLGGQVGNCRLMDEEGRRPRRESDDSVSSSSSSASGSGSGTSDDEEDGRDRDRISRESKRKDTSSSTSYRSPVSTFFDIDERDDFDQSLTPRRSGYDVSADDETTPSSKETSRSQLPLLSRNSLHQISRADADDDDDALHVPTSERPTTTTITSPPPPKPCPLDFTGPIDPRTYSAFSGARNIDSFVVEGEAGKGAYGLVRRAREKGPDGSAIGPLLIIKYIIKQRILADCWKRHKILGPIPVEIHVLDHLRRVPQTLQPSLNSSQQLTRTTSPLYDISDDSMPSGQTGHSNICAMLDFFEDKDFYYMVMPCFGDGQDLFDHVELAPDGLPIGEVKKIYGQIADGVAFLHRNMIVHRDIKDENVILDTAGNVQLIDFGSAAYIREGKKFDTFSGTLDFAAPEVLRGERYGGKETDVWALGVLGFVMLCGEAPFWNGDEAMVGLAAGTRAESAIRAKVSGGMTADVVDLVTQCLQIDSRDRPTALDICNHRLYKGSQGWNGERGWARGGAVPTAHTA